MHLNKIKVYLLLLFKNIQFYLVRLIFTITNTVINMNAITLYFLSSEDYLLKS